MITGCQALAVLEAAHINPYRGREDNNPANGLLLRSDVHTLFDLDLLGIEADSLCVKLNPEVEKEYGEIGDAVLRCASGKRPSRKALTLRYEQFLQRLQSVE